EGGGIQRRSGLRLRRAGAEGGGIQRRSRLRLRRAGAEGGGIQRRVVRVTLCKVLGPDDSTEKHEAFRGLKLLVVQPVDESGKPAGDTFLAVDRASGAGEGDTVLVLREGTGIRQLFRVPASS